MKRRELMLALSGVGASAAWRSRVALGAEKKAPVVPGAPGPVCFFSKFLPKLGPGPMAAVLKKIGYDGVDLTVRPRGHIEPADAEKALPGAVAAIREQGLSVPIVTTEILSASEPFSRPILATAGKAGVPMFKPGYWSYRYEDIHKELAEVGRAVRGLTQLSRRCGIRLGFHNHGDRIGGPIWDAVQILDKLDPRWAGYYFDTRHAFAEGGQSAWKVATHLVGPRVMAVSVKDFHWEKTGQGWRIRKVPLGQGMVDVEAILTILRGHGFAGPISVHLEYPIEGGEDAVLAAAERDLGTLRKILARVYAQA